MHIARLGVVAVAACILIGCGESSEPADLGAGGGDASFDQPPEGTGGTGGTRVDGGESAGGGGGSAGPTLGEGVDGFTQNPVEILFADPGRTGPDILGSPIEYASQAAACYEAPSACAEPACAAFATCCIDNGSCCKALPEAPLPGAVDFTSCGVLGLDICVGTVPAETFGPSEPTLTGRGLVPGGDATSEGGATLGEPVDLGTTRIRLDVTFSPPVDCGGTCLQSAGVAFSEEAPGTFVDAEVGLLLGGARNEVNLMIGGAVAETFDAGSSGTAWTLILSPAGEVEVLRDEVVIARRPFEAGDLRQASLIVFGRNLGATSESATIRTLSLEASICDVPSAWASREPVTLRSEGAQLFEDRFGTGPTLATDGADTRFAYALDGDVYWGTATGVAEVELLIDTPALSPTAPGEVALEDPELVYDGARWHLFYTSRDDEGRGSIGHAVAGPAELVFSADAFSSLAAEGNVASFDAPTVLRRDDLWVLVARAVRSDGATELRAFYTATLAAGWERIVDGGLETATRVEEVSEALTEPSLIVHNGAYQLYFARRTGTRWTIDALASDELLLWRPLGVALGPASGTDAFDGLGARAPDAISLTDRVDLAYRGQSASSFELGWAVRSAPSDTGAAF